jgi:hypothetical protein
MARQCLSDYELECTIECTPGIEKRFKEWFKFRLNSTRGSLRWLKGKKGQTRQQTTQTSTLGRFG